MVWDMELAECAARSGPHLQSGSGEYKEATVPWLHGRTHLIRMELCTTKTTAGAGPNPQSFSLPLLQGVPREQNLFLVYTLKDF